VFAVDDHGYPLPGPRRMTTDPEGEPVPAIQTADGQLIAKSEFIRAGLRSGDLVEVKDDEVLPGTGR